ncbi:MAG: sensor histidine kinase [Nocardioides sp.]|uniref:sensor histidine kinase n=1 Tax=Nocardioides sp. TaxID=35761 RepID=UPI003D6B229C
MLSTWPRRRRTAVFFVAAVLMAVQAPLLVTNHDVLVGFALLMAGAHAASAPLAMWRPMPAAGLSVVAFTVQAVVIMPQGAAGWPLSVPPQIITQLVVLLVLTLVAGWRVAASTFVVQLAIGVVLSVVGLAWKNTFGDSIGAVALFAALSVLVGSLGLAVGRLAESREALREEKRISAEEHQRRSVVEEKARIARELHDVIAHNMSLITVQARSAPHRVGEVSEAAEAEFAEIADLAASALRQMRGVLDVLRTEPGQSGRVPVPGIDGLSELFESARATGQRVEVHGDLPETKDVAPEVGAATYRIVQEALSNARRHAADAPVRVDLALGKKELEVRVANALQRAEETDPEASDGHGVMGMRERASAVGGVLTIAALDQDETDRDEFVVEARLPVQTAVRTPGKRGRKTL